VTSRQDVERLIRQCWEAPYGPGQVALADQAIRHADALGEPALRFEARLAGTEAYQMGGEPAKTFVTFSWCLAEYDANPGRYTPREDGLLRWYFKWVVGSLTRFPDVPLERTYAVLDDMTRRYRLGGHSLHAVYQHRWLVANHIGDVPAAEEWYEKWTTAPRDENSDCAGCDPTDRVEHLSERGRDSDAVALASAVLAGQLTCAEQPQAILTALLLPYLRTGRLDEARDAHVRAYRSHRQQIADLGWVADHVLFCGLTGNEARGLELIDRHLDWLERAPSPFAELEFAGSAAQVLQRRAVRKLPFRDGTAGELGERLAERARALAARFDKRNGTEHQSARIEARLVMEPLVDHLPLTSVARASARPRGPVAAVTPVAAEPPTDDPAALLDLVEREHQRGSQERVGELLHHLDRHHPDLPPDLAARRAGERGRWLANAGRTADAEPEFEAAIAGHDGAGDQRRAQAARARLGLLYCLTDRAPAGLELVEAAVAYADGDPDADSAYRAAAHLRRCDALMAAGRTADALAAAEATAEFAQRLGESRVVVEALPRVAHLMQQLDRVDEALNTAARAHDLARALGPCHSAAVAAFQHGELLLAAEKPEEAAAAFADSIELGASGPMRYSAHANRGKALTAAGKPASAVADLVEAVAGFVAGGASGPAAYARFDLAVAYHQAGQDLEAAEIGEEAVRALDAAPAPDAADRCRYLLSFVYRALDEPDQALAQLDELARRLDGFDNLPARGQMLEEAGQLMYQRDQDVEAAEKFAAAAAAYSSAGLVLDETRAVRWQALSLRWAELPEESLAALARADALAARLSGEEPEIRYERAMLGYDAARVLIGAERLDEALERVRPVAAEFRGIEAYGESVQADLLHGEILLRLGRPEGAEPLLRAALGAAPRDSDLRQGAAWMLAEALEAQGRSDEADAVRHEHDLD
jgi:tetratricopeptide (TPR) repeat protein